jgi:hypothetical protein
MVKSVQNLPEKTIKIYQQSLCYLIVIKYLLAYLSGKNNAESDKFLTLFDNLHTYLSDKVYTLSDMCKCAR